MEDIQWARAGEPAEKPFISFVPETLILQGSEVKPGMYLLKEFLLTLCI